ncbi:MAG: hypothetical protein ACOZB3_01525 [Calditrichota bacterium]
MNPRYPVWLVIPILLLTGVGFWVAGMGIESHIMVRPLFFSEEPGGNPTIAVVDSPQVAQPQAWLRVEVETSWGWFWQKSTGRAYVTVDKKTQARTKAGTLHIRLEAHNINEKTVTDADSISISERKRGLGIPKRVAVVTAWAENPDIEETTVALEP